MREDIFDIVDGKRQISLKRTIGKGYDNAWFTNCKVRYRLLVGARNTKKSKNFIGYEPILKILSDKRRNILMCRQNDCDNRQSSFANIQGCIYDLGLEKKFKITSNPLEITYLPTGQKIVFRGLNNPTSITSITFSKGYLTDIYIEEAFECQSYDDFRKIDGSLRGKLPDGLFLQITFCLNAWNKDCWIYEEFFRGRLEDDYTLLDNPNIAYLEYYDPDYIGNYGRGIYLHKSTYKINEFRDKENYDASMQELKRKAPEIYKVEALGMWGNATDSTYPEFNESCIIDIQKALEYKYSDFAIGIDTGLSDGAGHTRKVAKGEDVRVRIKSATTMSLVGVTQDFNKIVTIDEYFHSNDKNYNKVNTDNTDNLTEIQLMEQIIKYILQWIRFYGNQKDSILMKGTINVYVDCADVGFRQGLELKAREYGLYNLRFMGSTKIPIQSRVDFTRLMMAYGDYQITTKCPNLKREFLNSRKGLKGEPREDTDDHEINANEYAWSPLRNSVVRWKTFKEH